MIDLISRLDLFGSPVNLNINKFYFYRSKLGGMLSLGVAAVIILYLQSSIQAEICFIIFMNTLTNLIITLLFMDNRFHPVYLAKEAHCFLCANL